MICLGTLLVNAASAGAARHLSGMAIVHFAKASCAWQGSRQHFGTRCIGSMSNYSSSIPDAAEIILHQLSASGGSAEIIIQFFCDGYLGDSLPTQCSPRFQNSK
jgi:hypothetical protein